jgi:ATP-binding cassette subfamily C protein CydC
MIARAVIKDAPIFLLDEPTANLDPLTERDILSNLFEIITTKTTLLITHRLVGLDQVDQILVIDQGKIIERGTQAELLHSKGIFQRMWDLQNRILAY